MKNPEITIVKESFSSTQVDTTPSDNDVRLGLENLSDDQLRLVGGGDVVLCW